jgi:hypothetical protein
MFAVHRKKIASATLRKDGRDEKDKLGGSAKKGRVMGVDEKHGLSPLLPLPQPNGEYRMTLSRYAHCKHLGDPSEATGQGRGTPNITGSGTDLRTTPPPTS